MSLRDHLANLPIPMVREGPPVVSVVRLSGIIGGMGPMRRGMTLSGLAGPLERAFKARGARAVALAINSPGGSPVQSALIARRIRALAEEHELPVLAFAEDAAASGGYWLACAADEIFADESSLLGSIGVISGGFGFVDLLRRWGVERRLHTAGERKGLLDPFLRETPEDVAHLVTIQQDIHQAFMHHVRDRRGLRLKAAESEVFSGAFWTGRTALEMGLIDGLGDLRGVLRQRFGDKVRFKVMATARPWWRRGIASLGIGERAASDGLGLAADSVLAAVEERLWWNRLGL